MEKFTTTVDLPAIGYFVLPVLIMKSKSIHTSFKAGVYQENLEK